MKRISVFAASFLGVISYTYGDNLTTVDGRQFNGASVLRIDDHSITIKQGYRTVQRLVRPPVLWVAR